MLKHGRIGMTRPEHFPKLFHVYTQQSDTTTRGRVSKEGPEFLCSTKCILSVAKSSEIERFRQIGVTVTHDIIQRGSPIAKEQDTFVLVKNGKEGRCFRVCSVHNKGEMDIDTVYYCEERGDLKWDSKLT